MQITVYIRKLTADNYSPQWMKGIRSPIHSKLWIIWTRRCYQSWSDWGPNSSVLILSGRIMGILYPRFKN